MIITISITEKDLETIKAKAEKEKRSLSNYFVISALER